MRYWVLAWLCAAAVIAYVQRAALSVPAATIQRELAIGDDEMGVVMGAWFLGYAVLQIPAGRLADRWGSRLTLAGFALCWSLLTGLVSVAYDVGSLTVLWTMMGVAQAGLIPCAAKAISGWFGDSGRAFASGLFVASMQLGLAVAPLLSAALLEHFAWQQLVAAYCVPGVIWATAVVTFTPEAPRPVVAQPAAPPLPWARLATSA